MYTKIILIIVALLTSSAVCAEIVVPKELILGIFPRHNYTETIRMYMPLVKYLNENLNIKVKLETTRNYKEFWNKVVEKKYDIVHYNQYHYLISHQKYQYEIILKNEENNLATISSLIIVRKDSGINSLQDLKNKKIIFGGGKRAMMSYLIPTKLLANAGLTNSDYHSSIARNPPNALLAVLLGQADACGVGEPVIKIMSDRNKVDPNNIKILSQSDEYPHLAWAVNQSISKNLKLKLKKVLLDLNDTAKGLKILKRAKLTGLVPAFNKEYKSMQKFIED